MNPQHLTPEKLRGHYAILREKLRKARQIALMQAALVDVYRRRVQVLERENRRLREAAEEKR